VLSIKDCLDVDLKRPELAQAMSGSLRTSADDILATLEDIYNESIYAVGIDPTAKDGDDEGELEKEQAAEV